jgi:hypothetical protein
MLFLFHPRIALPPEYFLIFLSYIPKSHLKPSFNFNFETCKLFCTIFGPPHLFPKKKYIIFDFSNSSHIHFLPKFISVNNSSIFSNKHFETMDDPSTLILSSSNSFILKNDLGETVRAFVRWLAHVIRFRIF